MDSPREDPTHQQGVDEVVRVVDAEQDRAFLFDAQEFRLIPIDGADEASMAAARELALKERSRLKEMLSSH